MVLSCTSVGERQEDLVTVSDAVLTVLHDQLLETDLRHSYRCIYCVVDVGLCRSFQTDHEHGCRFDDVDADLVCFGRIRRSRTSGVGLSTDEKEVSTADEVA